MILAVDAGNSNIVLGCMEGGKLVSVARMETNRKKTENEYAATISQILQLDGKGATDFEGAIISSVVPPLTDTLRIAVRIVTGHESMVVGAGIKTGLNIGLDDPGTMGADLVTAAVAALSVKRPPLVIIDMGTATTMTVIGVNGRFLGGAILPGVGVASDALTSGASLLPRINIEAPKKCIGANTVDAMKSGAVFGTAGALDGMIDRIEAELGEHVTVMATGGLANRIIPFCRRQIILDDDLLLKGLWILWEKNKNR
jgi:type III pantothenate kinase